MYTYPPNRLLHNYTPFHTSFLYINTNTHLTSAEDIYCSKYNYYLPNRHSISYATTIPILESRNLPLPWGYFNSRGQIFSRVVDIYSSNACKTSDDKEVTPLSSPAAMGSFASSRSNVCDPRLWLATLTLWNPPPSPLTDLPESLRSVSSSCYILMPLLPSNLSITATLLLLPSTINSWGVITPARDRENLLLGASCNQR